MSSDADFNWSGKDFDLRPNLHSKPHLWSLAVGNGYKTFSNFFFFFQGSLEFHPVTLGKTSNLLTGCLRMIY